MKIRYLLFAVLSVVILAVGCDKEDDMTIPSIKLEEADLAFAPEAESQTFQFMANRAWKATWDADWISVEPSSGEASDTWQTVTISVLNNAGYDRTANIKITMSYDYRTLSVFQTGEKGTVADKLVFFNNFDKEAATQTYGSGTSWPYLDQFEGWKNEDGSGASGVTYSFNGMSARNNSNSNGSYSDYPGSGTNNLFFGSNAYFVVKNITLPSNVEDYTISFGTERYLTNAADNTFNPSEFHVYVSQDNDKWVEIFYTFANGFKNGRWDVATSTITVPSGTSKLSIYVKSDLASAHRLDDLRLEASTTSGTVIDFDRGIPLDGGGDDGGGGGGDSGDAIYSNDFDKEKAQQVSGVGWPFANATDIYKNHKGSGSDKVTYTAKGVTVRSNSTSDGSYSDYSGSGVNNMFFGTDNLLKIKDIKLSGQTVLTLTFGAEKYLQGGSIFNMSEFHIYVGKDTLKWVELTYNFANGLKDGRWDVANTTFSVPNGTDNLCFYINADVASAYRLDDFKLVEAAAGTTATPVDFTQGKSLDGDDGSGGGGGDGTTYKYKKATTITSGKAYLIVASSQFAAKPITNASGYGYLNVDNVTVTNDEITTTTTANEWTFTSVPGNTQAVYTIAQSDGKLLYQTGSYNSFNVAASPNDGQYWSVSFDATGQATITNTSVNKYIQYSGQHTSYGSYPSAQDSGVLPVLYEKVEDGGGSGGGGGDSGDGTSIKWTIGSSAQNWAESTDSTYGSGFAASDNDIKVAYYKNSSTSNPVTAYSDHIRVYKNSVLVITPMNSSKKIKSVTIEATGANYCSNLVVISDNNSTATASGSTISWSKADGIASFIAQTSNGQVRIKTITVVLSD